MICSSVTVFRLMAHRLWFGPGKVIPQAARVRKPLVVRKGGRSLPGEDRHARGQGAERFRAPAAPTGHRLAAGIANLDAREG